MRKIENLVNVEEVETKKDDLRILLGFGTTVQENSPHLYWWHLHYTDIPSIITRRYYLKVKWQNMSIT